MFFEICCGFLPPTYIHVQHVGSGLTLCTIPIQTHENQVLCADLKHKIANTKRCEKEKCLQRIQILQNSNVLENHARVSAHGEVQVCVQVCWKTQKFPHTDLNVALQKDHPVEVVKSLLRGKADPNQNIVCNSYLGWCARHEKASICKLLLKAKADVNAQNQFGWTALHTGACNGHVKVVRMLLGAKADVNATNNNNQTATDLATLDTIRKLLS